MVPYKMEVMIRTLCIQNGPVNFLLNRFDFLYAHFTKMEKSNRIFNTQILSRYSKLAIR